MAEEKVPSTESVQTPQPAPTGQPVQTPVQPVQPLGQMPQGAPANNKNQLLVIGAVLLVVAGVAGYGYWNGSQIKDYALKSEKAMEASSGWEAKLGLDELKSLSAASSSQDQVDEYKDKLKETKANFENVKKDAAKYIADLGKSAPGKAKELQKDVKEYFTLYAQISEEGVYSTDVAELGVDAVATILELSESYDPYATEVPDESEMYKTIGKAFQKWADGMKKLTAPESMKDFHEEFIKTLEDVADAFNSGDMEEINNMEDAFSGLDDTTKVIKDKVEKLDDLSKKIEKNVESLKSTSFSF